MIHQPNSLLLRFERLSSLMRQSFHKAAVACQLQPVQLEVLIYLSRCNRFSNTPISVTEYLGLTKGTVSQTIKALEKKQFLKKVKDDKDRRKVHLELTNKGVRLVSLNLPNSVLEELLEAQSQSVKALLSTLISQLLNEYIDSANKSAFGVCNHCAYNRETDRGFRCSLFSESLTENETHLTCRDFLAKS